MKIDPYSTEILMTAQQRPSRRKLLTTGATGMVAMAALSATPALANTQNPPVTCNAA
jgi:hypothetical protein